MSEDWLIVGGESTVEEEWQDGRHRLSSRTHKYLLRAIQVSASHHDLLLDGRRWLQPLKVSGLFVTLQHSSRRWKPVSERQKTSEELMATTTIGVEDLIDLHEDQRVWRLISHFGAMLDEIGRKYKLGPPPVRAEILAGQTLQNVTVTAPAPKETAGFSPVEALAEDEVLIVRRLPKGDIDSASSKTVLSYDREFEALVGSQRAQQLLDGSSGPEFVYWVVPARG